jgi:hypothetical protein
MESLGDFLDALYVRLVMVEDQDALARYRSRLVRSPSRCMKAKQNPRRGMTADRGSLRMDGLRLGFRRDLGVTPRTRASIEARNLGSGKLK